MVLVGSYGLYQHPQSLYAIMYITSNRQRKNWINERLGKWGLTGVISKGRACWAHTVPSPFVNGSLTVFQRFPQLIAPNPVTKTGHWLFTPMRFREDRQTRLNSYMPDDNAAQKRVREAYDEGTKEITEVMRWGIGQTKTFGGL